MKKYLLALPLLALVGCKGHTYISNPLASLPAPKTLYTSSSTGSDSNPGTQAAPLKTIAAAMKQMNPGDTLLLNGADTWTKDCVKLTGSAQAISSYGTGLATLGSSCAHGVESDGFSNIVISNVHVTGTTGEGIYVTATKAGNSNNVTIDGVQTDNTGWSGILVHNVNDVTAAPITGLKINNVTIGAINVKAGLNYNLAGIELLGVSGAMVNGGSGHISTGTQMAIQDRIIGPAATPQACGKNTFTKLNIYGNEGGVTAVCPNEVLSYSHIYNGKGFGAQVGVNGQIYNTVINNLTASTDGKLYNGIDGNGSTNAVFSNVSISNVVGCAMTAEGVPPYAGSGIKVNGGTIDATAGGQCALYTSSAANKVTFDGKTTWKTNSAVKAFHVGGLAYADMMTQTAFLASAQ